MSDRSVLGPADVSDRDLERIVAGWLGAHPSTVELLDSSAQNVAYDLDAITTAGRYWVSGRVRTPSGIRPFRFFVKHVQSWSRSPLFAQVPPEYQEMAEAGVPWSTEPLIYRSDLRDRLPAGLTMPRAVAVRDLDEKSAAVWLEEVPAVQREWTTDQLARAAYRLGRLAASPSVRELASIGERARGWPVRSYVEGRLTVQIMGLLRSEEIWRHPLVAPAFDPTLRRRMLAAADRVPDYLAEIEQVPLGTAHGDACTNNLLGRPDSDDLVLIDYGFWSTQPLGFDLTQLLVGDVQIGRRPATCLWAVERACTPAYIDGLRAEGCDVDAGLVRRSHALLMLIFSGLSAIPIEHLDTALTPELHRITGERAAMARFTLDLVDATAPSTTGPPLDT
jgi:hypothetical protein